jgi:hypothetical protein
LDSERPSAFFSARLLSIGMHDAATSCPLKRLVLYTVSAARPSGLNVIAETRAIHSHAGKWETVAMGFPSASTRRRNDVQGAISNASKPIETRQRPRARTAQSKQLCFKSQLNPQPSDILRYADVLKFLTDNSTIHFV